MRAPAHALAGRLRRGQAITPVKALTASRQPPVMGWNTVLPVDSMKPEWAVKLDNFFPQPGYVELRGGNIEHSDTTESDKIESLMAYHALAAANDKLFAAVDTKIYDVTGAASSSVTGLTNARWQHINFTTSAGKFLFIVNGADNARTFDGSAWATPAITVISSADAIHVASHKNRIWMVLKDSTKGAYLPVDSIAGAAATFEFGTFFTQGGYLNAIGTWTRDGGSGPDDYFVAISSRGQIAVFQGTDPASANTWSHVGTYDVGAPIGRRCFLKVGADIAIVTVDGILPMSQVPGIERGAAARIALTANIQPTMNLAARNGAALFGWQLVSYPKGTMAILNVPITLGTFNQYVMNTITGAWCRFTGMEAYCWENFKDRLFFGGGGGKVFEADVGAGDDGLAINAEMRTAFDYFGERGRQKQWKMCRPKLTADATAQPQIALNVDFRDDAEPATIEFSVDDLALWDAALWDVAEWPPEEFYNANWVGLGGIGFCASLVLKISALGSGTSKPILRVNGMDYVMEPGGIL